ncbi:MAG: hypothetical protein QXD23_01690 [Candidatus Micrarchaeaceae archaeon]
MPNKELKRYGLESVAKVLIVIGFLLVLTSWVIGFYNYGTKGTVIYIVPLIFTFVLFILLLFIRYRYTLFEKYPYFMNLPSLFYRIKDKKGSNDNKSLAFSMIFTVHSLVIAFLGLLSIILVISIGHSVKGSSSSLSFLYLYTAVIIVLLISVLYQYRRIYVKFSK